ncbi:hypothetical protein DESC_190080 [Desulfosarcina cetonica]|nr:hypothetical protein DESC_190080 [Desulfosarcina cetonica]
MKGRVPCGHDLNPVIIIQRGSEGQGKVSISLGCAEKEPNGSSCVHGPGTHASGQHRHIRQRCLPG